MIRVINFHLALVAGVLLFCLLMAVHDAHGQTPRRYLKISPTAECPAGCGVEWRLNWMGSGRYFPLGISPVGQCWWLSDGVWFHWSHGWFENRCVATDGREPGPWGVVQEPSILALQDGVCQ